MRLASRAAVAGTAGTVTIPTPPPSPAKTSRLHIRWLQELPARAAWELAQRLVAVAVLPVTPLGAAPHPRRAGRCRPSAHPAGRPRCSPRARRVVPPGPVPPRRRRHGLGGRRSVGRRRRRGSAADGAVGVSAGTACGPSSCGATTGPDVPVGAVLVVATSTRGSLRSSPGWGGSSPRRAAPSATWRSSPASTTSRPSSASLARPRGSTTVRSSPSTAARAR